MSLLICPRCSAESFLWTYDEEETPPTSWHCGDCGYSAREDEALERECSGCNKKTESQLEDDVKTYWWCSSCNKVTLILEK